MWPITMQLAREKKCLCVKKQESGKDKERWEEERERSRKEKSRDGEAAIDLILQQEIPRGEELVLLEMQPAFVENKPPCPLSLSLSHLLTHSFLLLPFFPYYQQPLSLQPHRYQSRSLPSRCFKKQHAVWTTSCFYLLRSSLSLVSIRSLFFDVDLRSNPHRGFYPCVSLSPLFLTDCI